MPAAMLAAILPHDLEELAAAEGPIPEWLDGAPPQLQDLWRVKVGRYLTVEQADGNLAAWHKFWAAADWEPVYWTCRDMSLDRDESRPPPPDVRTFTYPHRPLKAAPPNRAAERTRTAPRGWTPPGELRPPALPRLPCPASPPPPCLPPEPLPR